MKLSLFSLIIGLIGGSAAHGQNAADSTGLPGDNFSLEAALEAFKKSESPEAFEKMLNTENNEINNLDLNGDGQTDYIKVIDKNEDRAHAFILQAVISENENQDIAVIELEKNGDDATLQIIGDEDIYGEEKIVEPSEEVKRNAGTETSKVIVNVHRWPVVKYVYGPAYRVWISPWGWAARPAWWRPWRPIRYHIYHAYHGPYLHRYAVVHTHRTIQARRIYAPARTTSVIVRTLQQAPVNHYRTTRTTTVTTPRGQATKKTTTVRTKGGKKVKSGKRTTRSRN